jgi:sentrin-specific protease 1
LTRKDLHTLKNGSWLNDEVINLYGKMILQRSKDHPEQLPRIHMFNSFFYSNLTNPKLGYDKVRRWSRRFDVFAMDMVLFPVNLSNLHWVLGIINFKKKQIEYYDSFGKSSEAFFAAVRDYVEKESLDKKKTPFDWAGWTNVIGGDQLPQQENGYDCGVFCCMYAVYFSVGRFPSFAQKDLPFFRKKIAIELMTGKFLK